MPDMTIDGFTALDAYGDGLLDADEITVGIEAELLLPVDGYQWTPRAQRPCARGGFLVPAGEGGDASAHHLNQTKRPHQFGKRIDFFGCANDLKNE